MKQFHLHLVSDSTGETVSSVARAAVVQFEELEPEEHVWSLVRTRTQMEKVIQGHLYEHIFVRSLLLAGKKCAALKGLRHAVLYNLAHSKFNVGVRPLLSAAAYAYYKDAFDRFPRVGNAGSCSGVSIQ